MKIIKQIHNGYKKKISELQRELNAVNIDFREALLAQKIEKPQTESKQKEVKQ